MVRSRNPLWRFFGVILNGQTYLNLLYLLLTLPLGILYFVFFTFGVTLGIGLSILLIGFVILIGVAFGWWAIASFERYLAIWLLRVDVPPMEKPGPQREGWFGTILDWITNPVTWKSLLFILIKLPLGIFIFTILVTLAVTSLALTISPILYSQLPLDINLTNQVSGSIDTLLEAIIACIVGILLGFASLHVFNYLAYACGLWAKVMLGNPSLAVVAARPELPLQPVAPAVASLAADEVADAGEPLPPPFYEPEPESEPEATPPHGIPAIEQGEIPPEPETNSPVEALQDIPPEIQADAPPEFFYADEEDTDKLPPPSDAARHTPPFEPPPGDKED